MSQTIRAVDIRGGTGPVDSLYITDVPKPTIGPNDALVKVKAFGLNRMDLLQREGNYPLPPWAPKTLGCEFSGIITELGSSPEPGFEVGEEVFGLAYGGAYAEYIAVSTKMLARKPDEMTFVQAASIPETYMTSLLAMYITGEFKAGKSILWHAGASSVGIAGIQLSVTGGASAVFATVGSDNKVDFCERDLGATKAFNYHSQDWSQEVLNATGGKGVDVIIDAVGASHFQGDLNAAARDGRIVNLGWLSGTVLPGGVDIKHFIDKRLRYEGTTLRSQELDYQHRLRDLLEGYMDRFRDGTFKVVVEKVFPWEQIVEAHRLMEKNVSKGKIVCTVD
ncbi:NAD(P)-binding protein [Xylona heveae TC161]|uniref:NAD(P)-binding protein n=1 Tax=Xylona heveae (strain CBS 132557 / TC161) TaxID=1328760 RepID=A0A164ZRT5_XYLHT|nr:NAD(P)-binding protein [Xylona heveae TC161]KZF19431.1 NAD(P)-binding protein [Xylona heveae TC161]